MVRARVLCVSLATCAFAMLLPRSALAQNTGIAGVVKDATGAVIPGVTVEASSPALIEKARTAVSDSQGQYKILDLVPGTYAVTFTLSGFNGVKRAGIELTASFTATVNAELRVGAVEETITVSGAAPTVDVQNVIQQTVLRRDTIDAVPTGSRSFSNLAVLIPGTSSASDVGGTLARNNAVTIHDTRATETVVLFDGMPVNHGGGVGGAQVGLNFNNGAIQEINIQTGGLGAESELGGLVSNMIPRDGANSFKGVVFGNYTNHSLQANNLTASLQTSGLTAVNSVDRIWDFNPGFGGPIAKDTLWFYGSGRYWGTNTLVAGNFFNKTPNTNPPVYTPDPSRQATYPLTLGAYSGRLTWQPTPRNKITTYYTLERTIYQHYINQTLDDPDVTLTSNWRPDYMAQARWSSPVTSRLLLEAGWTYVNFDYATSLQPGLSLNTPYSYRELSTGYVWGNYQQDPTGNAPGTQAEFMGPGANATHTYNVNFAASYVTGSHAAKFGFRFSQSSAHADRLVTGNGVTLQLRNGIPTQLTEYATPLDFNENLKANLGIFGQDQWTIDHLTINAGVRYDYLNAYIPAQTLPAGPLVAQRSFQEIDNVPDWKDISPRLGVSYDLFGNGKTAVKGSVGRYLGGGALLLFTRVADPVSAAVATATRTWNDANHNLIPDCNLANPATNGECGPLSDSGFGGSRLLTSYDNSVTNGYGARNNNWEVATSVQHELLPGLSLNAAYFRRWYDKFAVTDNLLVAPSDYSPYCITAPNDPRLPNGGGYQVCGLDDVSRTKFGQSNNLITQASNYGDQREIYNGVDLSANARLPRGIVISGGTSTGRTETSACFVIDSPQQLLYCDVKPPFQTQLKGFIVYPLPWGGVQTSAAFQSIPGPQITASYTATNAQIAPSLGRNLASCGTAAVCNGTATVPLIAPGTMYGERLNQLDFRLSKTVKVGRSRIQGMLDVFNVFNASPVLTLNNTFGSAWQRPQSILQGRLLKLGAQIDF
jgi:Carboxypeptidase regulatory-like domain/TonB-dependent Receptor Plug Domain